MNLPYSAESTETGIAGDSVSVVLMEQLNSSTVYFYTASTVSGDITVIMPATFTTPHYSMHSVHSCMYYIGVGTNFVFGGPRYIGRGGPKQHYIIMSNKINKARIHT